MATKNDLTIVKETLEGKKVKEVFFLLDMYDEHKGLQIHMEDGSLLTLSTHAYSDGSSQIIADLEK
jgi:hypothetical protein